MEEKDIEHNTIQLVQKLKDKLNKCEWRKSNFDEDYTLSFSSGIVKLEMDKITVLNPDRNIVMEYKAKSSGSSFNLPLEIAKLYGVIDERHRKNIDAHLDVLMKELDKMK